MPHKLLPPYLPLLNSSSPATKGYKHKSRPLQQQAQQPKVKTEARPSHKTQAKASNMKMPPPKLPAAVNSSQRSEVIEISSDEESSSGAGELDRAPEEEDHLGEQDEGICYEPVVAEPKPRSKPHPPAEHSRQPHFKARSKQDVEIAKQKPAPAPAPKRSRIQSHTQPELSAMMEGMVSSKRQELKTHKSSIQKRYKGSKATAIKNINGLFAEHESRSSQIYEANVERLTKLIEEKNKVEMEMKKLVKKQMLRNANYSIDLEGVLRERVKTLS